MELYDDPDAVVDKRTRSHYIEAVTGATFKIKVMFTTDFELYHLRRHDAIYVWMRLDAEKEGKALCLKRENLEQDLLKGQTGYVMFESRTAFLPETGSWKRSDYSFGELEISANDRYTSYQNPR